MSRRQLAPGDDGTGRLGDSLARARGLNVEGKKRELGLIAKNFDQLFRRGARRFGMSNEAKEMRFKTERVAKGSVGERTVVDPCPMPSGAAESSSGGLPWRSGVVELDQGRSRL